MDLLDYLIITFIVLIIALFATVYLRVRSSKQAHDRMNQVIDRLEKQQK